MSKLEHIQQMALRLAGEIARMQNEFKMELLFDTELQAEMAAMRRTLADLARVSAKNSRMPQHMLQLSEI